MKWLVFFLVSFPALAAKPTFSIMVKRKYDNAFYKITKEGKLWVCKTNHFPYYEAKENPLAKLNWKELEKESKSLPQQCQSPVVLENSLDGKTKMISTCLSQKETLSLYERISELCRSKI